MADLTPDDLRRLREITEKAVNHRSAAEWASASELADGGWLSESAGYIAAFSPDTALLLLDMAERTGAAEAERDAAQVALVEERGRAQETLRETLKRGALVCREAGERLDAAEAEANRLRAVLRGVSFQPAYHFTHVRENKRMADTTCEACDAVERVKAQARAAADGRWDIVPPEAKGERRG